MTGISGTTSGSGTSGTSSASGTSSRGPTRSASGRSDSPSDSATLAQQADQFRSLLDSSDDRDSSRQSLLARSLTDAFEQLKLTRKDPGEATALQDASAAFAAAAAPASTPVSGAQSTPNVREVDSSFAQLMDIHVRSALLALKNDAAEEIRIEMSDAVLPDTSLSLRQSEGGWQLDVVTTNKTSLDRLGRYGPALVKRFSQSALGTLEIRTTDRERSAARERGSV